MENIALYVWYAIYYILSCRNYKCNFWLACHPICMVLRKNRGGEPSLSAAQDGTNMYWIRIALLLQCIMSSGCGRGGSACIRSLGSMLWPCDPTAMMARCSLLGYISSIVLWVQLFHHVLFWLVINKARYAARGPRVTSHLARICCNELCCGEGQCAVTSHDIYVILYRLLIHTHAY